MNELPQVIAGRGGPLSHETVMRLRTRDHPFATTAAKLDIVL